MVETIAFSPNGERLVVVWGGGPRKTPAPALTILYTVLEDGVEEIARYEGWKEVQSVAFSPDGGTVAVAATMTRQRDLYLWNEHTPPSHLTNDKSPEGDALFSLEGDALIYRVREGAGYALLRKGVNGSERNILLSDDAWRWQPLLWEGEGGESFVLHQFRKGKEIGLASVPSRGGTATKILDGEGVEEGLTIRGGALLFRRGQAWLLCQGIGGSEGCQEVSPHEEMAWSGRLVLGPDSLPGGVVLEEGKRRVVLRQENGEWRREPQGDNHLEVTDVRTEGAWIVLALQRLGTDAFVEIVSWDGQGRIKIGAPVVEISN